MKKINSSIFTAILLWLGVFTASASTSKTIKTADDETPIFITLGQSNADGSAFANAAEDVRLGEWYDDETKNPKLMKVWYHSCFIKNQTDGARWVFDGSTVDVPAGWLNLYYKNDNLNGRTSMNMIHGNGTWSVGAAGRRGMEGEFGKEYQTVYPTKELYLLKLGCSGSRIETWSSPSDSHNWTYFYENIYKPAINELLKQGKKPRLAGIWWMQGEGNGKDSDKAAYQKLLTDLISNCREKFGFENAHFYIGHIVKPGESTINPKASTQYGQAVRNAQDAITNASNPSFVPFTSIIDGRDCKFDSDNLHWGHEGINAIGKKIATEVLGKKVEGWAAYSTPGTWNNLLQNVNAVVPVSFSPTIGEPSIAYQYKIGDVWVDDCPTLGGTYDVQAYLDYGTWQDVKQAQLTIQASLDRVYVTAGGTGDGTNWENAMGDLDLAIKRAKTEVLIANGTYSLSETLIVPAGISLKGGYDKGSQESKTCIQRTSGVGDVLNLAAGTAESFAQISYLTISGATNGRGVTALDYSVIDRCIIEGNKVIGVIYGTHDGAGVYLKNNVTVSNTIIKDNSTTYIGGGVSIDGNNSLLINCLITGNLASGVHSNSKVKAGVGGILSWSSRTGSKIINCTVTNNNGKNYGAYWGNGGNSNATIANSIFWGNKVNSVLAPNIEYIAIAAHRFVACASTQAGVGFLLSSDNTNATGPKFNNPEKGDYELSEGSPCVNTGDNASYVGDINTDKDLFGSNRLVKERIDCGAYELSTSTGGTANLTLDDNLILFPNPVTDNLYYQNTSDQDLHIVLRNIEGKELDSKLISAKQSGSISMKTMPSGIYLINCSNLPQSKSYRIIKAAKQ